MAQMNIVTGLVRGKLGEGFGDPYNCQTYYKELNTRYLVQDKIRQDLIKKYGFIGGVTMRTINMIYNMYVASNCKALNAKDYWSAVNETLDIKTADIYNLAKVAYKYTDLSFKTVTKDNKVCKAYANFYCNVKKKVNKTSSLVVFAYDKNGDCVGQTYSAPNNAYWDEKKQVFVVPKDKRFRWQKAEGGEFEYAEECFAEINLIRPIEGDLFVVAYNVEVGNQRWIFSNGTEVVVSDDVMTQLI